MSNERLAAIMEAAAKEYPQKIWSAAEVYAMAREVKRSREMSEIRASYRRVMLAPDEPAKVLQGVERDVRRLVREYEKPGGDPISQPGG